MQRLLLDYINIFSKMAQCKDGFPNTLALSSLLIMGSSLWCANLQYCSTNNWPGLLLILSNDGLHLWFIETSPRGHEKCWIYILGVKSLVHSRNWYESFATVGEIRVYQRADFQSGSRVLKKVLWTLSYLYLWHTMWFHAKKLLKTLNR